jgi:selenocysteine lyase/cysteine desulfurase
MLPIALVGDDAVVPCLDGVERRYAALDAAASTSALPAVAARVTEFLPWYSSVHRGAGYKSRQATQAYEDARAAALAFGRGDPDRDIAILCRNTTEALNHLAYRLRLAPDDVVLTTVVEHHANLLPWARVAQRRYVECDVRGTFGVDDVIAGLEATPRPRLLAITAASNVTGWLPPIDEIIEAAHERGVPVVLDAAQCAPHRPIPAGADAVAWSGHKMYAPFGTSALVAPREWFTDGDPFLAGGGAVDLVDLDEVVWTDPPEREEAGSPNVVGAVGLHAAIDQLGAIGWDAIAAHEHELALALRAGLGAIDGVHLLGPSEGTLAIAAFTVDNVHHALVAARLAAEFAVGVRHGCFCAHPYLLRLLDLSPAEIDRYRADVLRHDRRDIPGAVRASASIATTTDDIDRLLAGVSAIASGEPAPGEYVQDAVTGDYWPAGDTPAWVEAHRNLGASCARG